MSVCTCPVTGMNFEKCNYKNCTSAVVSLKINESRKYFTLIRMCTETLRKDVTGMWIVF